MGLWNLYASIDVDQYVLYFQIFCFPFVYIAILTMITNALRRQLGNATRTSLVTKRYAHAPMALNWQDPLNSASLLTEEEVAIQETANSYCQERMLPRVLGMNPTSLQLCIY